jgi:NADPH-dependent curcumin reductase CurA
VDLDSISLEPDEVLIKSEMFSVDAFVRTMLDADAFHGSIKPGSVIPGMGFGTVVKTGENEAFKIGTRVAGLMQVATLAVASKSMVQPMMVFPGVKPSLSVGLMGVSGLTAYFGMFHAPTKGPQAGETVVVSAAAGSVGSIAAQMAKLSGARVVGIAGGPKKSKFLIDELKLDGAIDYKDSEKTLAEQLAEQCPDGIDFFFDNVGGETLDAVLEKINSGSRIVICGAISQYNTGNMYKKGGVRGPSNYVKLAERNSSMVGFTLMNFVESIPNVAKAMLYLLWHYKRGNLKAHEHVENGIESFGNSLEMLFTGGHMGRLVVDVQGSPSS